MLTRANLLVIVLALIALSGLAGVVALSFAGKPVDGSLIAVMSGAAGALGGLAKTEAPPLPVNAIATLTEKAQ